jgi:hypothetical protein
MLSSIALVLGVLGLAMRGKIASRRAAVLHQVGVAAGDGDVALGQHHVHVGEQRGEERPLLVHGLERRCQAGVTVLGFT